jgi:hypothetical protein
MVAQRRLFRPVTRALNVHASYDDAQGWSFVIVSRRDGESWAHSERDEYDLLTAPEFLQAITEEITRRVT